MASEILRIVLKVASYKAGLLFFYNRPISVQIV